MDVTLEYAYTIVPNSSLATHVCSESESAVEAVATRTKWLAHSAVTELVTRLSHPHCLVGTRFPQFGTGM